MKVEKLWILYIFARCWNLLLKYGDFENFKKIWWIRANFWQKSIVCVEIIFYRLKKWENLQKKTLKVTILFRNPLGTFWKHVGNNFLNPTPPHPLQKKNKSPGCMVAHLIGMKNFYAYMCLTIFWHRLMRGRELWEIA